MTHPNPMFRTEGDLLAAAASIGFAHIFVAAPAGPMVVHAPLTLHGREPRFHLARANRAHDHVDGATVIASLAAPDGYVSPNWYARLGNQVPTWNYVAVEIEGRARTLPEHELLEHLDALADTHEPRPDPWTRGKADPAGIGRMLCAIEGFALDVSEARGTTKLSQNKAAVDKSGVVAGLRAAGNDRLAALMDGPG